MVERSSQCGAALLRGRRLDRTVSTILYWGYIGIDVALCRVVRGHQDFVHDAEACQGEGYVD